MRFIGNKESLAPQIFTLLQKYKVIDSQKTQSFFDLFSGSASMAKFFKKQGFQIYSNDILYFSYCLQRAYIQNNEIQLFAFVPTFCVLVKTEVVPIKMNSH